MKFKSRFLSIAMAGILALTGSHVALAAYTIADNYEPERYTATASQTAFTVSWPFEANADLVVKTSTDSGVTWTTKTLTTDYSVTGAQATSGGTVTFVTGRALNELVVIYRNDGIDRTSNFTTLTPTSVEAHFDKMTMLLQQVESDVERRALLLPDTENFSTVSNAVPTVVGQAGQGLCVVAGETGLDWCAFSDVTGPASATDNAIVRWNGTSGDAMQNSVVIVSDLGLVSGVAGMTIAGSMAVSGTVAAGTVTGANVTTGANPGHTHSGSSITDASITADDLAADSVAASEIATGAVGAAEIATGAVGTDEIASDGVGSAEIATGAVGTSEILNGAISSEDLAPGAVDEAALGTGSVTTNKIVANAITAAKMADNSVGLDELAPCDGTSNQIVQYSSMGVPTCIISGGDVTGSFASLELAAGSVGLTEIDGTCEGTGNEVVQFATDGTPTCTIAGGDVTGSYGNLAVGSGKITTGKILDNTITVADINAGEVFEVDGVNGGQIAYGGDSTQEDLILVANTAAWSLVTGTIAANNAILWTSVESGQTAVNGAQTRVSILHRTSDGALDVTVSGSDIFITTERASGVNVTTAADVIAAVNADGSANALVLADDYSTSNGTGVVTETNTASAATQGLVPLHGDGNIFFGAAADNGYNTASYDMRSGRLLIGLAEPLNLDAEGRAEATATGGLEVQNTSAGVEAEKGVMRLIARTTSAGTLTGYGVFTGVFADNSVGTIKGMGKENWTWTDPTDGSEDAIWSLDLKNAGTDNTDVIYVDGTGVVRAKTGFKINSGFASCDHLETDSSGLMTCVDDPAGTFTYNPGSLGALGSELNPFTCTGGVLGDTLVVAPGKYLTGMMISAQVGAADLCYVTLFNPSGGALDAASSTWTWKILR